MIEAIKTPWKFSCVWPDCSIGKGGKASDITIQIKDTEEWYHINPCFAQKLKLNAKPDNDQVIVMPFLNWP